MVRALLFDFDGLIADTEVPIYESWRRIYAEYGAELSLAEWLPVVGSGTSLGDRFDAVRRLEELTGRPLDRDAVVAQRRALRSALCEDAPLRPGVEQLLEQARGRDLKTGIVTRARDDWVERHSRRLGLGHEWDALVCANGDYEVPKSGLYLTALDALGVAPAEAIAFEDSPAGVAGAREARIFCVAVPNDITRGGRFDHADVVMDSLVERPLDELLAAATAQR